MDLRQDGVVERIPMEEFEQRVRDGLVPGDAEIRIEVVTAEAFVRADTLEIYRGLADPDIQVFRAALKTPGVPIVTAVLIGIQIRIYLLTKVPGGSDFLLNHLPNWAPGILEQGQVHRLFSYGFLHLNLSHLLLNLVFLGYVGWNLERALGRRNLLCVFTVSVFLGGLLSMLLSPGRPSLGSSGGDFGLLAASVVFGWKHELLIPVRARRFFGWAVLPYLVFSMAMGFQSPSVDNWGHAGGLLGGWAMATVLEPEAWKQHREGNKLWRRIALVCVVLAAGLVSWQGPTLVGIRSFSEYGVTSFRPRSWDEEWTLTGDRGWTSRTRRATWVRHAAIHDKPQSLEGALEILLQVVDSSATQPKVLSKVGREVSGQLALEVVLEFDLGGAPHIMRALLMPRGAYLHRFHLHSPAAWAGRYAGLAERLFSQIELADPPGLLRARAAAAASPRNREALVAHGHAAADAGYPAEGAAAYRQAVAMGGTQSSIAARGWLNLYAGYGVGMETSDIGRLAVQYSDSVPVLLSAVEAYDRAGLSEQALSLLEDADARFPNHFSIGRARAVRGL